MKRCLKGTAFMMLMIALLFFTGCKSEDPIDIDVRVTTYAPQDVTQHSAVCGGDVIVTQGLSLTELGVCWSTEQNPTVQDAHLSTANWSEPYVCTILGLEPDTRYHVRAYALRGLEYYYGDDKSFVTEKDDGGEDNPIEGALYGKFTVNDDGDQVCFSQGNLQYQASTHTWRFAENQWDHVGTQNPLFGNSGGTVPGSDNVNISDAYDGWIDLFGWGTSGYHDPSDPCNVNYQPWSTSDSVVNESFNVFGYGPSNNMLSPNLTETSANYDWGVYNPISNGDNQAGLWRTPTLEEWSYLFYMRSTNSSIRFAKAMVNNVSGVILLPDDWSAIYYSLNDTNQSSGNFACNTITASQWDILENYGAVFLPAAGYRDRTLVGYVGSGGSYWSTSYYDSSAAYGVSFNDGNLYTNYDDYRYFGRSVRLVRSAQ